MNEEIKKRGGKILSVKLSEDGIEMIIIRTRTVDGKDTVAFYISNSYGHWILSGKLDSYERLIQRAKEIISENPLDNWIE